MTSGKSDYLSAKRDDRGVILRQAAFVAAFDPFRLADHYPLGFSVLNDNRQIVGCNAAFTRMAGKISKTKLLGLRFGEALGCVNAYVNSCGCGTSVFCRYCGAARAVALSLRDGVQSIEECRFTTKDGNGTQTMELQTYCSPLPVEGKSFITVSVLDISDQKRRYTMERYFFHDVINSASGMQMLAAMMRDGQMDSPQEVGKLVEESASHLLERVQSFKEVAEAERRLLRVDAQPTTALKILEGVRESFREREEVFGKKVSLASGVEHLPLVADSKLVVRVLNRLVENALEVEEGSEVLLSSSNGQGVRFAVHNSGYMEPDVQRQLFVRSFSTKGDRRGFGLYSVSLIVREILGGEVGFETSREGGTDFFVRLPTE